MPTIRELARDWSLSERVIRNARARLITTGSYPGEDKHRETYFQPVLDVTSVQKRAILMELLVMAESDGYRKKGIRIFSRNKDLFEFAQRRTH